MPSTSQTARTQRGIIRVGFAIILLASCDAPNVTAPRPTPAPASTAASEGDASFLGQATLGPSGGSEVPFAGIRPATWVVVRISGQFTPKRNAECDAAATPHWACPTATGITEFSEELSTLGPIRIWRQTASNKQPVPVRAAGGGGLALLRSSSAATLLARVHLSVPSWHAPWANPIPAYTISGSYSVTAEEIPAPAELTESAGDASGVRKYTLAALHGLQFVNPEEPYYWDYRATPFVTWRFIPGENVSSEPGGYVWNAQPVPCNDMLTCTFKPTGPGKMEATAWVEGREVVVRSSGRSGGEPFELKCNGASDSVRIARASNVDCRVTGTDEITAWSFRADAGGYTNPAANATPFRGAVWAGKMVLGGIVSVSATVAGREDSRSVHIRVEGRDWTGISIPRDISEQPVPPDHLPARPDSVHQLGDIHQSMSLELGRGTWEPILSGPNANLAYFTGVPAQYEAIVHVNRAALAVGSDFWNAQYTRQRSSGVVDCLQREADIVGFIPVILRHEGIGFDPKSHAFLYVVEAEQVGNPGYERAVAPTPQELADSAAIVLAAAHAAALRATSIADSAGYRPSWCRFHFNYPRR